MSLLFFILRTEAQVCKGSLGDPVVNITFGSGLNPGPPLSQKNTNYGVVYDNCPSDGFYSIFNRAIDCGWGWHNIPEDHTPGDVNGYMMVVNASYEPGIFYQESVSTLCAGTTYEFAAWIVNLLKPDRCQGERVDPNITFTITDKSGNLLAPPYNTGTIKPAYSPEWKQYGMFFTTGSESEVVITMYNNAPGGCGNDLALDDITFRPCGLSINSVIEGSNTGQDEFCVGESRSYQFSSIVSNEYKDPVFQWQKKINNGAWTTIADENTLTLKVDLVNPSAGTYYYRMASVDSEKAGATSCLIFSEPITIKVNPLPMAEAKSNGPVCLKTDLQLIASGGDFYQWTGPNGFTSNLRNPVIPNIDFSHAGEYRVLVTSSAGCVSEASTKVEVKAVPVAAVKQSLFVICEGESIALEASGGEFYEWSPATGLSDPHIANPLANPLVSTTYTVKVTNGVVCTDLATVAVKVVNIPVADAGKDTIIFEDQSINLGSDLTTANNVAYRWTPEDYLDDPTSRNPIATPKHDITYTLQVIPENECTIIEDKVFIRVYQKITIRNSFSPNGDGINDVWNIDALDTYPEAVLEVYNRNGQKVFESRGYQKPWDGRLNGKLLPVGTYYYVIDLKNGTPKQSSWVFIGK